LANLIIENNVFKQLKKLFSSDVVVRNIKNKHLRVIDTYNTQAMGSLTTNYMGSKYRSLYSSLNSGYGYNQSLSIQAQRLILFREYELMDQDPLISSGVDLMAEESCVKDEFGKTLSIKSDDQEILSILNNLFYDILNIDFNLIHWTRNLVKYGDMMLKLDLAEKLGIINALPLSPYSTTRIEGENVKNPYEVKYRIDGPVLQGNYENYEIAHFRLLTDTNFLPYGKSMIESARRIWKQLTLMEDAMLIHRIMRAPMKRVFKIDVGNLQPNEVDPYMEKIINTMQKVPYTDEQGNYNLKYNMQNITEDFYLPKRGGDDATGVDVLGGLEYNAIDDVEYLKNKLMSALRIPKAFLGYESALGGRSVLTQQDIRFARTIERIQKTIIAEFKNLAMIHLFIQGYKDEDLLNFEINMASPSTVYEQEKIELWKQKAEVIETMKTQKMMPYDWLYKNVYELGDDEIKKYKKQILEDTKFEYRLIQVQNQGNDPLVSGQHVDDGGTVRDVNDPDEIAVKGNETQTGNNGQQQYDSPGQPEDLGPDYKKDKHFLGRNPLGQKDTGLNANKLAKGKKKVKPFSLETLQNFDKLSKKYGSTIIKKINILGEEIDLLKKDSLKRLLDDKS